MTATGRPAPPRPRVALGRQLFGVLAAPAAWAVQFEVGYGLTSYACSPGGHALAATLPGWGWTRGAALAFNLVAALVALWAGLVSHGTWRAAAVRDPQPTPDITQGRTRFFGLCGMLTSFGFLAAIAFDTVMILGAPACRG